ncbi:PEPxxWA-CTERM sorting domain-containing protein [Sphingomonas sp. 2R-10]|uniref:PEPxxWA-CTERM sorting domain-containing protein n=1 Tax=Sphingomonas sp. 2R-10 TaxID=3045148 RepID=UPI000F79DEDE|nr:PEPxxWA-CTERM sorting domain-containing protein [Sphingomonas sp. 2R-10]MDJ0278961.1 PEPxxWA-CTERM sorting domain-containing protein [Sphingomonas sp. 2R-10]
MMNTKTAMMMMAAPLALAATPADAATFLFQITGGYQASFAIDSAALAPPAQIGAGFFTVFDTPGTFGGVGLTASSVTFNTTAFDGGLTIELPDGDFRGFLGSQLFTGTTAMPSLLTGAFTLASDIDQSPVTITVSQSVAAVPEPATWAMMIIGFGAVGIGMRRRAAIRTEVRFA